LPADYIPTDEKSRYSGITLTLPKEYRPKYGATDPLLQSSSEESPLDLNPAVKGLLPADSGDAVSSGPSDQSTIQRAASAVAPAVQSSYATMPRWQPPPVSWRYCASGPNFTPEIFNTVPHQSGRQGAPKRGLCHGRNDLFAGRAPNRGQYRGRNEVHQGRISRRGQYRGRNEVHQGRISRRGQCRGPNDFYVGRVSLPTPNLESILPWNLALEQCKQVLTSPKSSMDFFIPSVVQNSAIDSSGFEHQSETCTTWRCLSSVGAEELFIWTKIYRTVLAQRPNRADLPTIAVEMVKRYEQGPPAGLDWFLSAPNIHLRVERFLSISMQTPSLQIEELEMPVVGLEYTLAPQLLNIPDDPSGDFAREIVLSTSADWLIFDASCHVFSGIVPSAPPRKILVKAKVIEYLDERVRIEHVIRASVNLKARSEVCAEEYFTEIFTKPTIDRETINENSKPRKQVSFADEHESDSLSSSPDRLRSFFNDLAALTRDPNHHERFQEPAMRERSHVGRKTLSNEPVATPGARLEANAAVEIFEKNTVSDTSHGTSARIANSPSHRHLASANSPGQLYLHLRQARAEQGELVYEETACPLDSGTSPNASRVDDHDARHSCAGDSSCGGNPKTNRTWNKPISFLDDVDTSLNLEVALGLSSAAHVDDEMLEDDCPTPLAFRNRFDSLSKRSNMDRPTQVCESIPGSEAESDQDLGLPEHAAFGSKFCTTRANKQECFGGAQDLRNDLYQWNWKGWEREIGIIKRRRNKNCKPELFKQNLKDDLPSTVDESGIEQQVAECKGHSKIYHSTKNGEAELEGRSHTLPLQLPSPTLSYVTTSRSGMNSSNASWSTGNEIIVLDKATNSVNNSATLYDSVRSQFYKDYYMRQMSSPRTSKPASARTALSSAFSRSSEHQMLTENRRDHIEKEDLGDSPSGVGNEDKSTSSFRNHDRPMSPNSLESVDEPKPDIGSIAAAVKKSLEADVQGQDGREEAEIRKGILHHQFMDLRKQEQRRDFGSSNYDDIFWGSDGVSVDDRLDSGMD
jgi:hypothetical protein